MTNQNDPGVLAALLRFLSVGMVPAVESDISTETGIKPGRLPDGGLVTNPDVERRMAELSKGQGAKRKAPADPNALPAGIEKSPWFGDVMGGRK